MPRTDEIEENARQIWEERRERDPDNYPAWDEIDAAIEDGMHGADAMAQQAMCGPREQILGALLSQYKEKPVVAGLSKGSGFLTVITASSAGTWTELVIEPDGKTCMVDSGEGWQANEQPGDGT